MPVLAACLRGREVPARLAALGLAAIAGAAMARLPLPAADPGLDAVAYPTVLVGVAAPVLVGALMAVPTATRLDHLTATGLPRARWLRAVEFVVVTAGGALAAAACGAAADLSAAAVQNALVTGFAAIVLSSWVGPVVGTSIAACIAVVELRVVREPTALWIVVDTVADTFDGWVITTHACAALVAFVGRGQAAPNGALR